MNLRAAQADAYTIQEHKALVATIDGLFDQLAMALPTMSGLQKAPSKTRVDDEEPDDAASKRAKGEGKGNGPAEALPLGNGE